MQMNRKMNMRAALPAIWIASVLGSCAGGCSGSNASPDTGIDGEQDDVRQDEDGDGGANIIHTVCSVTELLENQTLSYTCTEEWSDGRSIDCTGASSVSGDCTGGSGTITGNNACGSTDPAGQCAITCSLEHSVILHDDGDSLDSSGITIEPASWEGWGLDERIDFACSALWSDGEVDPDCTCDPVNQPTWSASECGSIDGGAVAAVATWNSGYGACSGQVTVSYAGAFKSASVTATMPTDEEYPPDYHTYTDLPYLTDRQKMEKYCSMTAAEWQQYYEASNDEAVVLSDQLEDYIRNWYYNGADSKLPPGLLPDSINNEKTKDWTLVLPEEVNPEEQWYFRPAMDVPDENGFFYHLGPDNHVTYLKLIFIAPFGSQLLIEGDFPHARFMDYQILGPYDPEIPSTSGLGSPEVPIVDVDIVPDSGHTNPFLPGADRNSTDRHYHITFDLEMGNAVALNPQAMVAPAYRAPGNNRVGGPFGASGPNGDGQIIASVLWLRYYASDHDVGHLGGVSLPKAVLQLSSGERFWLRSDFSLAAKRQYKGIPSFTTPPEEPNPIIGPELGWLKIFGFWRIFAEGYWFPLVEPWTGLPKSWAENWINTRDECWFGRGANRPPPGNHEISASGCNYNSYLVRPLALGSEKVYVLTGKLPTTPETRNGEATVQNADARYWSVCHTGNGPDERYKSLLYGCLMDDEIELHPDRTYIIAYSRDSERPANATRPCGITWQDWGHESRQTMNLRWLSVMPEDFLSSYSPHEHNIPWSTGAWSVPTFDPNLVGYNGPGVMGPYHPVIHYLSVEDFEALGCPVDPGALPMWTD